MDQISSPNKLLLPYNLINEQEQAGGIA